MLLALLLTATVIDVLDVDAIHGPYHEIRDAVAAAHDGDVIRVAPGTYGGFSVLAKSLVVETTGLFQAVRVDDAVHIADLAAGQTVVLNGIHVHEPTALTSRAELVVSNCGGPVRVQSCSVFSRMSSAGRVLNSSDVTFEHTVFVGADNTYGAAAIWIEDSSVVIWSTTAIAGATLTPTYPGTSAVYADRSELLVIGGELRGGTGGTDEREFFFGQCVSGGMGGAAIYLRQSTLRELGGNLFAGSGGPGSTCGWYGPPGVDIVIDNWSTAVRYPGVAPSLAIPGLVAEGSPFNLLASGAPTDTILLIVSDETSRVEVPGRIGDLCVGASSGGARRILLGTGNVAAQLQAPTLPPFGVAQMFLQTVHLRGGQVVYGPTRAMTVLDSAW